MNDRNSAFLLGLLAGIVVAVSLLASVDPLTDLLPGPDDLSRTDQAREIIEDSYFKETDPGKLEDASIDAMVRRISKQSDDKFSNYFDAQAFESFQAANEGKVSGIGVTVTEIKRGLRITEVFKGSPAADAGLDRGDLIVAAEGKSLRGVSSAEAASRIKGEPGTEVEIGVLDGDTGKRSSLEVERASVKIPAVRTRIERQGGKKIGYVRLSTFSRGASVELRRKIEKLLRGGAEGIVFDLRGNGGGLVDEAVLVTSIFQEDGPVVTIEGRKRDKQTLDAEGDALDLGPVAVLVDGGTASASEIVTAALEENGLATVIGTRTFGKGVFQEVIPLDGGGALDITVGEYLTADGTSILGKGVVPDQRVVDENLEDRNDVVLDAGLRRVRSEIDGG